MYVHFVCFSLNSGFLGKISKKAGRSICAPQSAILSLLFSACYSHSPSDFVSASPDREAAYPVTIDGEDYLQQVFTVESPTWVDGLTVNVSFQDGADVPAGTRIVDENNQDITQVKVSGTGTRYN